MSRTGYTFKGWNTNSGATTGSTGTYTPTSSATMYAIWQLNAPSAATATLHYAARDRLSINLGYTGAALTGYTLYYRVNGSTAAYSSMSVGTATNGIITNLQPNTTYQIYVRATNAAGSKDSAVITAKTISDLPSRVSTISTAVSHNSISAEVGGTGDTNDAIQSYSLYCIKASSVPVYNMPIKEFDGKL